MQIGIPLALTTLLLAPGIANAGDSFSYDFSDTSTLAKHFTTYYNYSTGDTTGTVMNSSGYVSASGSGQVSVISNQAFALSVGNTYEISATFLYRNYIGIGFTSDPDATGNFVIGKSISIQASNTDAASWINSDYDQQLSTNGPALGDSLTLTMNVTCVSAGNFQLVYSAYDNTTSSTLFSGTVSETNVDIAGHLYATTFIASDAGNHDQLDFFSAGNTTPVPEPSDFAMLGGLGALGLVLLRRKSR
jgi:hypothetical protein